MCLAAAINYVKTKAKKKREKNNGEKRGVTSCTFRDMRQPLLGLPRGCDGATVVRHESVYWRDCLPIRRLSSRARATARIYYRFSPFLHAADESSILLGCSRILRELLSPHVFFFVVFVACAGAPLRAAATARRTPSCGGESPGAARSCRAWSRSTTKSSTTKGEPRLCVARRCNYLAFCFGRGEEETLEWSLRGVTREILLLKRLWHRGVKLRFQ